jgi:hypothetical protein
LYENKPANFGELAKNKELYFVHFPLKSALKQGIVRCVENIQLPARFELPEYMLSKKTDRNGKLECWHIINYKTWERKPVNELNEIQLKLSPWGSWNDILLVERLSEGWTPELWK